MARKFLNTLQVQHSTTIYISERYLRKSVQFKCCNYYLGKCTKNSLRHFFINSFLEHDPDHSDDGNDERTKGQGSQVIPVTRQNKSNQYEIKV